MLNNYTLYKKLEEKLDNSINEIKKENLNTFIRFMYPLIITITYDPLKENNLLILWSIITFVLILHLLTTFDLIKNNMLLLINKLYELIAINTNIDIKEKEKNIISFKKNYNKYYRNLTLINTLINKKNVNIDEQILFLLFVEDELSTIINKLNKIKHIIEQYNIDSTNIITKEYYKLLNICKQIIESIENNNSLKITNNDLYIRFINLL